MLSLDALLSHCYISLDLLQWHFLARFQLLDGFGQLLIRFFFLLKLALDILESFRVLLLQLFDLLPMLFLNLLNLLLEVSNSGSFGRVFEIEVRNLALHVCFNVLNEVHERVLLKSVWGRNMCVKLGNLDLRCGLLPQILVFLLNF